MTDANDPLVAGAVPKTQSPGFSVDDWLDSITVPMKSNPTPEPSMIFCRNGMQQGGTISP
jgi:hypothetical protein